MHKSQSTDEKINELIPHFNEMNRLFLHEMDLAVKLGLSKTPSDLSGENYALVLTTLNVMEEEGLVKKIAQLSGSYQLTAIGVRLKERGEKYDGHAQSPKLEESQEEVNRKLNEIIAELQKQGLGQEVLFEELEELRELYSKIGKKNWRQLLIGKLRDLVVDKAVSADTANFIFKKITDADFPLLGS